MAGAPSVGIHFWYVSRANNLWYVSRANNRWYVSAANNFQHVSEANNFQHVSRDATQIVSYEKPQGLFKTVRTIH